MIEPSFLFGQFVSGLSTAMYLFLIASGLSLIFGVLGVLNFAHGSFYMLGAYLAWQLVQWLGPRTESFWVAVLVVLALGVTKGVQAVNVVFIPLLIVAALWYLAITSVLMVGQHFLEKHGHVLKHRRTYRLIDASNRSHARGPRRESREDTKVCRIPGRASDADTRFAHNDNDSSSGGSSSADSSAFSHSSRFSFHSASSQSSKRLP